MQHDSKVPLYDFGLSGHKLEFLLQWLSRNRHRKALGCHPRTKVFTT